MRKAIIAGAVCFLLGAAASPKAASDGETRTMLCARFTAAGGPARIREIRGPIARLKTPQEAFNAEANALEIMDRTFCH
jgi:hypothetical protein